MNLSLPLFQILMKNEPRLAHTDHISPCHTVESATLYPNYMGRVSLLDQPQPVSLYLARKLNLSKLSKLAQPWIDQRTTNGNNFTRSSQLWEVIIRKSSLSAENSHTFKRRKYTCQSDCAFWCFFDINSKYWDMALLPISVSAYRPVYLTTGTLTTNCMAFPNELEYAG